MKETHREKIAGEIAEVIVPICDCWEDFTEKELEMNSLKELKKSRPKFEVGDYFYYKINGRNYIGLIIHTQFDARAGNSALTCLFLDYTFENLTDISEESLRRVILNAELLIPPININKRGWSKFGYFVNIGNLNLNFARSFLQDIRFTTPFWGDEVFNLDYIRASDLKNSKLIGTTGFYASEAVEPLLQISLNLDFTEPPEEHYDPYNYYDRLKSVFPEMEYPFWYYKAKEKLCASI